MACNITITEVVGLLPSSSATTPEVVRVSGTASECAEVEVFISCDAGTGTLQTTTPVAVPAGTWQVDIKAPCRCRRPTRVVARCVTDSTCQDTFSGALPCRTVDSNCPTVVVDIEVAPFGDDDVAPSPCNPDGTHPVTFTITITPAGPGTVVSQMDFGDGALAAATTANSYTLVHDYVPPGPYTATLNIILPEDCPPMAATVSGLGPCDCAEVGAVTVEVAGCAGGGTSASVAASAVPPADDTGCEYRWDWGDGTPEVIMAAPSATHSYAAPGTYSAAVVLVCGTCVRVTPFTVVVPPCCALVESISATVEGCAGDGSSAATTFIANTNPPSAAGTYQWSFGDGTSATTSAPTVSHSYGTSGARTVSVTLDPSQAGCPTSSASASVTIPDCGGSGGDPEIPDVPDGGGSFCTGLRWTIVILTALAAIAFYICICVPAASPAYCYVAAGLATALALVALWWGIFCKKPCGWGYLSAWQSGLTIGIGALYFAPCCTWLYGIAAGALAAASVTFARWVQKCKPDRCTILAELAVVLAGVIVPALGWIAGIPLLTACLNSIVASTVATLSGILAIALAACAKS